MREEEEQERNTKENIKGKRDLFHTTYTLVNQGRRINVNGRRKCRVDLYGGKPSGAKLMDGIRNHDFG